MYHLQNTAGLIYTSWTIGRPITKVVSIGLVHLFPMLQNEKKSGKNAEVMMRLSVVPSRAARFASLKWHPIYMQMHRIPYCLNHLMIGPLLFVPLAIFWARPFRVGGQCWKPACTGEALPQSRESVQTSLLSVVDQGSLIVAEENNAIWTQHFPFCKLSEGVVLIYTIPILNAWRQNGWYSQGVIHPFIFWWL